MTYKTLPSSGFIHGGTVVYLASVLFKLQKSQREVSPGLAF